MHFTKLSKYSVTVSGSGTALITIFKSFSDYNKDSKHPTRFFPWGQRIMNTCCFVCLPDVFHAESINSSWLDCPDTVWNEVIPECWLLNPKASYCLLAWHALGFARFDNLYLFCERTKKKIDWLLIISIIFCWLFPVKNKTKHLLRQINRLADFQPTHGSVRSCYFC